MSPLMEDPEFRAGSAIRASVGKDGLWGLTRWQAGCVAKFMRVNKANQEDFVVDRWPQCKCIVCGLTVYRWHYCEYAECKVFHRHCFERWEFDRLRRNGKLEPDTYLVDGRLVTCDLFGGDQRVDGGDGAVHR